MVRLFCTGLAVKQFLHALVMLPSSGSRSITPVMSSSNSSARRVSGTLAWLDQVELTACRRLNRVVRRNGALQLFRVASRLGDGVLWYALIGVLALAFGPEGRQAALECAFAGVAGLLIYRHLKNVLVRERPYMTHAVIVCAGKPLDRFSFPSGHTLHAVSFTVIAASAFPALALVLVPAAVLIALSRMVLGLHYPSDVLAGGLLGAAVARATLTLVGA
jgi:undecaprenyl-diphosphatase